MTDKEKKEKENAVGEKAKEMSDIESALYHWEEWREKDKPVTRKKTSLNCQRRRLWR